jgi:hypothetical protein
MGIFDNPEVFLWGLEIREYLKAALSVLASQPTELCPFPLRVERYGQNENTNRVHNIIGEEIEYKNNDFRGMFHRP